MKKGTKSRKDVALGLVSASLARVSGEDLTGNVSWDEHPRGEATGASRYLKGGPSRQEEGRRERPSLELQQLRMVGRTQQQGHSGWKRRAVYGPCADEDSAEMKEECFQRQACCKSIILQANAPNQFNCGSRE